MTAPKVLGVFPKFLVRDVAKTLQYYRDVLGFEITNSFLEPPVFGIVERDGHGLHVKRGEPRTRKSAEEAWDAYVEVRGLDRLHEEFVARGAKVTRKPETMPYRMKEFDVVDPDGYVVCFAEEVGG